MHTPDIAETPQAETWNITLPAFCQLSNLYTKWNISACKQTDLTRGLCWTDDAETDSLIDEQDLIPWRRFFIGDTSQSCKH